MRTLIVFSVIAVLLYAGFSLMLYFLQERLVFLPHMPGRELETSPEFLGFPFEDTWIETEDGERILPGSVAGSPAHCGNFGDRREISSRERSNWRCRDGYAPGYVR